MKKYLNLGCGKDIRKSSKEINWVNADSVKLTGVDKVINLNKYPWAFKENEFDLVYCDNVLEHLESIIKPTEEIWRILKNDGSLIVKVPIYPSIWAFTDPTHKSVYTYITFNYFRPEDSLNYYSKARFKILRRKIIFNKYLPFMTWLVNLNETFQKIYYFFFSFIVPANQLNFELKAIKSN